MRKILIWISFWFLLIWWAFAYTNEQLSSANDLAKRWIINNHMDNPMKYNLDSDVLRQEIWAITRWVAWLKKASTCKWLFTDLTSTKPNTWACVNIEPLVENNLISKNKLFRPEDPITKTETLWMLIKAIWFDYSYDSKNPKNWQEQIVDFAVSKWIVKKFTDYNTDATRWWVFKIADFSIKLRESEVKKVKDTKKYSDEAAIDKEFWIDITQFFND